MLYFEKRNKELPNAASQPKANASPLEAKAPVTVKFNQYDCAVTEASPEVVGFKGPKRPSLMGIGLSLRIFLGATSKWFGSFEFPVGPETSPGKKRASSF